ncbi:MAG: hypothetical protein K1X53_16470 [Candidatus Sumerlaeaceae bacterium]|nr:hypothetical protein [Candidatus Sumerlaeaceae bacterium]
MRTTYVWHLHQPIYFNTQRGYAPDHYEAAWDTIQAQWGGRTHPSDSVSTIFGVDDRKAAYQYRPKDSVQTILGQPDAGVQVQMSGALIENVNSLSNNLSGYYSGWQGSFQTARGWQTSGGKPRMDMVNFTYHHSLAPLHTQKTFEWELRLHKRQMELNWGNSPGQSQGYFPTEMCFAPYLIPTLKAQGINWTIVSGNHLSRACSDFPLVLGSGGENCEPPNKADILNPAQTNYYRQQISRGCAPCNAAPFAYTPHRARYVDPNSGTANDIVIVPSAMEFSWIDGYQCFGANDGGLASVRGFNNPSRPMLLVLSHDGDNAFAGGYSYYMECVNQFANNAPANGMRPSTVEQYLLDYPVPANDYVHVETGGWVNADGDFGSPTYINWLYPLLNSSGQPDPVNGWHEKSREYAMFLAAENRVRTAEQVSGSTPSVDQVLNPNGSASLVERAWHYYLGALDSGNVYYGTPGDMETRSTVGINHAVNRADQVLVGNFSDTTPPSVFIPQRWPYNPGEVNFGVSTQYTQKTYGPDFTVWTFAYDVSGVAGAVLKWRVDNDGTNSLATDDNEKYAGGSDVGAWQSLAMAGRLYPSGNVYNKGELDYYVLPTYISNHYSATITGQASKLIDYYVEVTDTQGNIEKTPIQHVYVGDKTGSGGGGGGGGGGTRASVVPATPTAGQQAMIQYDPVGGPIAGAAAVNVHWGVNNWASGTVADTGMTWNASAAKWQTTVTLSASATQLDMVFNNNAGTWDNNSGQDWHFTVQAGAPPPAPLWTIDGTAESNSYIRANNGSGLKLWAMANGNTFYVATQASTTSPARDHFIFLTSSTAALRSAPWAKGGQTVAWDAFLANESTNNFIGWFDSTGGQTLNSFTTKASVQGTDKVMEGTIDLQQLYAPKPNLGAALPSAPVKAAAVPAVVYVAAIEYGTNDGDSLVPSTQVPATVDSNTNLNSPEMASLSSTIPVELTDFRVE